MYLKNTFIPGNKIILGFLLIFSLNTLQADLLDSRGSIFTVEGIIDTGIKKLYAKKKASPLEGSEVVRPFGIIEDDIYGIKIFNESVTLKASDENQVVKSLGVGKVVFAGESKMLGNVIVLAHTNKIHTVYANLAAINGNIEVGMFVKERYELGVVDDTLVFQITQDKKYVNPLDVLEL